MANATANLRADLHDPHTKFPYVLVCSTFGAIVSLASVWLVTALTYAPVVVA